MMHFLHCTYVRCCAGPSVAKILEPMFTENLDDDPCDDCRPILYACENDFGPVRDLRGKVGPLHTSSVSLTYRQ